MISWTNQDIPSLFSFCEQDVIVLNAKHRILTRVRERKWSKKEQGSQKALQIQRTPGSSKTVSWLVRASTPPKEQLFPLSCPGSPVSPCLCSSMSAWLWISHWGKQSLTCVQVLSSHTLSKTEECRVDTFWTMAIYCWLNKVSLSSSH